MNYVGTIDIEPSMSMVSTNTIHLSSMLNTDINSDHVTVTTTEIETGIVNNLTASGTTYSIYRCLQGVEEDIEHPRTYK